MHAVIYTKDNCPYCTKAKMLMNNRGITYDERLVNPNGPDNRQLKENQSWSTREQLLEAAPTARTFPQIWLDESYIGGCDALEIYLTSLNHK
jgi:glutaredoxin 3